MSLIGLEPWYAGRRAGRSGRRRDVYGTAVNDSIAWLRMSSPLEAVTCRGMVFVFCGSRRPSVCFSLLLAIPVFACISVRSKMLTPVVSLPVPAVVGTAISGLSGPGTGIALPIGAFT